MNTLWQVVRRAVVPVCVIAALAGTGTIRAQEPPDDVMLLEELILSALAEAQGPETPVVAAPRPQQREQGTPPAVLPPPVMPASPMPTLSGGILLNFRDASLDSVLEYLSEVAGFSVVRETPVQGRITVMSRSPLAVDDALALLNVALKEKGYAAIAQGRILKIVPLSDAKKRSIPVRTGNDPSVIEPTDRVVTQIIPVRYVDATRLRQDLSPLVPSYAELTANASSNTLIYTDTEANIRRIVEIVRALDTTMAAVAEIRTWQLKYAAASTTAQLITQMFPAEDAAAQRQGAFAGGMARFFGGAAGGQPTQQTEGTRRAVRVIASADDRTNTLVVSAPPDSMTVIAQIVEKLDASPAAESAVFIYPLKNAQAKNVEAVLNNLFGTRSATTTGGTTRTGAPTRTGATGGTTTRTGAGTTTGTRTPTTAGTSVFSNLFGGASFSPSASTIAAASSLAGQVYVVADADTNSLMVMTASKNFDDVRKIIADLDRPVPQVLIKVLFAEVTHDKSLDLGTELSFLNLSAAGTGVTVSSEFGVTSMTSGLAFRYLDRDVTAALGALQKIGKLDILSRPYILASDNQQAQINVGLRYPFITNSRITETGQTVNTIQYQDIGLTLTVTPHINPEGLVILDVSPEITTPTATTVPITDTVSAPVFAKRSASSRVAIRDGQTIVIGGLMEDRKTEESKGVPFLGQIPILAHLFKRSLNENSKTELLIFLTPHVASMPEMLSDLSAGELEGTRIVPKAVSPGAFSEHMESMQRRGTSSAEQGN